MRLQNFKTNTVPIYAMQDKICNRGAKSKIKFIMEIDNQTFSLQNNEFCTDNLGDSLYRIIIKEGHLHSMERPIDVNEIYILLKSCGTMMINTQI